MFYLFSSRYCYNFRCILRIWRSWDAQEEAIFKQKPYLSFGRSASRYCDQPIISRSKLGHGYTPKHCVCFHIMCKNVKLRALLLNFNYFRSHMTNSLNRFWTNLITVQTFAWWMMLLKTFVQRLKICFSVDSMNGVYAKSDAKFGKIGRFTNFLIARWPNQPIWSQKWFNTLNSLCWLNFNFQQTNHFTL